MKAEIKTKIVVANRPTKLEYLINEELLGLLNKSLKLVDIKYSINEDVGSALIIYKVTSSKLP